MKSWQIVLKLTLVPVRRLQTPLTTPVQSHAHLSAQHATIRMSDTGVSLCIHPATLFEKPELVNHSSVNLKRVDSIGEVFFEVKPLVQLFVNPKRLFA